MPSEGIMPRLLFQAAAMMSHLQTEPQSILAMRPYMAQAEHIHEIPRNYLANSRYESCM